MTEQQMEMIKRLSDKYKISAESIDKTLLLLGAGYGLNETQIEEYLSMGDGKLMEKHLCMLCTVLGAEKSDVDSDIDGEIEPEKDDDYHKKRLEQILQEYYNPPKSKRKSYEKLAHYVLEAKNLSAAQIEQLRLAASTGMPEKDVLILAKAEKEPMEIKRCVEFYEMVQSKKKKGIFFRRKS